MEGHNVVKQWCWTKIFRKFPTDLEYSNYRLFEEIFAVPVISRFVCSYLLYIARANKRTTTGIVSFHCRSIALHILVLRRRELAGWLWTQGHSLRERERESDYTTKTLLLLTIIKFPHWLWIIYNFCPCLTSCCYFC